MLSEIFTRFLIRQTDLLVKNESAIAIGFFVMHARIIDPFTFFFLTSALN